MDRLPVLGFHETRLLRSHERKVHPLSNIGFGVRIDRKTWVSCDSSPQARGDKGDPHIYIYNMYYMHIITVHSYICLKQLIPVIIKLLSSNIIHHIILYYIFFIWYYIRLDWIRLYFSICIYI